MHPPKAYKPREIKQGWSTPTPGAITIAPLHKIVETKYNIYSKMVIEDRALPDFRDGLIPVYRRILYTMYDMGIHFRGGYKKAARINGAVMGIFHPHNSMSIHKATESLVQSGLVDGQGNWGDVNSNAGDQRYVECRLSKYSDKVLLDPYYLKCVPYVPTYTGETIEPLYLPALLPNALIFGMEGGIAVGTTSMYPPFHRDGVEKLMNLALQGQEITSELCVKYLTMDYKWGGNIVSTNEEMLQFYSNGEQTLRFSCDFSMEKNKIRVTGVPPRWDYDAKLAAIQELDNVQSVKQHSDKNNPINVIITVKDPYDDKAMAKLEKALQSYMAARTNITMRYVINGDVKESGAQFRTATIPKILMNWAKWRIALERRALGINLQELRLVQWKNDIILKVIDNLAILFKILQSNNAKASLDQQVMQEYQVSLEGAKYILSQETRRWARLHRDQVCATIVKLQNERNELEAHLLNPVPLVMNKTANLLHSI